MALHFMGAPTGQKKETAVAYSGRDRRGTRHGRDRHLTSSKHADPSDHCLLFSHYS